jgi:hypothetical protein
VLGGRNQEQTAARRLHVWIASFNALVALALTGPLLLLLVLDWFRDEHASLANRGLRVVPPVGRRPGGCGATGRGDRPPLLLVARTARTLNAG